MTGRRRRTQGTGSVRRLPSGRWQARYPAGDGRQVSGPAPFATRSAALGWLAQVAATRNPAPVEPEPDPLLPAIRDALDRAVPDLAAAQLDAAAAAVAAALRRLS